MVSDWWLTRWFDESNCLVERATQLRYQICRLRTRWVRYKSLFRNLTCKGSVEITSASASGDDISTEVQAAKSNSDQKSPDLTLRHASPHSLHNKGGIFGESNWDQAPARELILPPQRRNLVRAKLHLFRTNLLRCIKWSPRAPAPCPYSPPKQVGALHFLTVRDPRLFCFIDFHDPLFKPCIPE